MSNPLALIVEDNEDQAYILDKALQAAGFETELINDGRTALKRLAVVTPGLVVLDLHLPGVSGTGVLLQIRADPRLAKTCVIIATVEPETAAMLHDKADMVLTKPVEFIQLRDLAVRLRRGEL